MADAGAQTQAAVPEPLGAQGEPCRECGAPLAADQRYCLNCGARRADPRVEYRRYMRPEGGADEDAQPASQPTAAEGGEPAKPQRDYAPLAAVAGIAVLGLMLLVGVLIGKGNSSNDAATPQTVVVKGSGEESASSSNEPKGGGTANSLKGGGGSTKHKAAANESGGGGGHPVEASDESLNELNSESGENYVEESKKIPDEVVTPGKPPPIDKSKPPGGGEGGAEVIK